MKTFNPGIRISKNPFFDAFWLIFIAFIMVCMIVLGMVLYAEYTCAPGDGLFFFNLDDSVPLTPEQEAAEKAEKIAIREQEHDEYLKQQQAKLDAWRLQKEAKDKILAKMGNYYREGNVLKTKAEKQKLRAIEYDPKFHPYETQEWLIQKEIEMQILAYQEEGKYLDAYAEKRKLAKRKYEVYKQDNKTKEYLMELQAEEDLLAKIELDEAKLLTEIDELKKREDGWRWAGETERKLTKMRHEYKFKDKRLRSVEVKRIAKLYKSNKAMEAREAKRDARIGRRNARIQKRLDKKGASWLDIVGLIILFVVCYHSLCLIINIWFGVEGAIFRLMKFWFIVLILTSIAQIIGLGDYFPSADDYFACSIITILLIVQGFITLTKRIAGD